MRQFHAPSVPPAESLRGQAKWLIDEASRLDERAIETEQESAQLRTAAERNRLQAAEYSEAADRLGDPASLTDLVDRGLYARSSTVRRS